MCHHVWAERLSRGRESEVAASPADWEPQMEGEASWGSGVKGVVSAGRWQCPDCLQHRSLGVGVILCVAQTGPAAPAPPRPAQRWATCRSLASACQLPSG